MTLFGVDKRVVSKRVVSADVPPEPKPERGYVRQNHPFRKPTFYLPVNQKRSILVHLGPPTVLWPPPTRPRVPDGGRFYCLFPTVVERRLVAAPRSLHEVTPMTVPGSLSLTHLVLTVGLGILDSTVFVCLCFLLFRRCA